MHKKKQQPTSTAAPLPVPEKPKPVEEKTTAPPSESNENRLDVVKNYIEQKRYDDASTLLTEGLAAEPNNNQYKLQLLNIYALTGQHEQFDNMYQTLQTQADMVTLQQAKEIKQEYTERFPQEVADTSLNSDTERLSTQSTSSDSSAAIEEDLSFAFENELSFDDEISIEEETSSDNELSFTTEDEDSLSLSSEAPASLETNEDTLSTSNDSAADEDIFNFDELESQLLASETNDEVVETSLDSDNALDLETTEPELTQEFNLEEDFITEEPALEESDSDLNLESIDDNEISFDDEDLLQLSEIDEQIEIEDTDTASVTETSDTSESDFDFDLDLSDEVNESSETSASQPVEQDLVSDDNSIDFFDDASLEESTDTPASSSDAATHIEDADTTFDFEIDEDESQLETAQQSPQAEIDEFDFDLTETEQNVADNINIENTDDDIDLDWNEPQTEIAPAVSQPTAEADVPESSITEESTDAAVQPVAPEPVVDVEEQVFEFETDNGIEPDTSINDEPATDIQAASKDEATEVSPATDENTLLQEDEDLIFNEGVADTISQLDALDFDFDADYDDSFDQPEPTEQPTQSLTDSDAAQSLDSTDLSTSAQTPVTSAEQPEQDKVSTQPPTQVDTSATETKAAPVTKIDKEFVEAFDFVEQLDKSQITLDLAEQYLDLGEYDSAKRLVNEVLTSATDEQHKTHAQALLERMH